MVQVEYFEVFYYFTILRSGTAVAAAIAFLAFLAATTHLRLAIFFFSSFKQDHQLKSSQLELNPHSAGDSDV